MLHYVQHDSYKDHITVVLLDGIAVGKYAGLTLKDIYTAQPKGCSAGIVPFLCWILLYATQQNSLKILRHVSKTSI